MPGQQGGSLPRRDSSSSLTSSQPTLTRHTSRSSLGGLSSGFLTTATGVRVRQRTFTRFEALKRDVYLTRLVRCRGLSQVPAIAVDADIVVETISPALPDHAELKFVEPTNDGLRLVVISTTTLLTFTGKRTTPARQGEPITDGVKYTVSLSVPLDDVEVLYDSTVDETVVYVHTKIPARMSQRDMEARLFSMPTVLSRDKFIAHLLSLVNDPLVDAAAQHRLPLPTTGVQLKTWESILGSGDDVRRNLAAEARRQAERGGMAADAGSGDMTDGPTTMLEPSEMDLLHIAENREILCAKIKSYGDSRVLFSSTASLKDNTHDVVIVCDQALYMAKQRNEQKLRSRIPYDAMEGLVVDNAKPVVILKLDFSKVTIKGDMSLTFPSHRNRDLFVSVMSSAFEAAVIDRLLVSHEDDVFWSKRGLVESQLLRVVSAVKTNRFTRAIGSAPSDPNVLPPEVERACKWLLYELRTDTRRFLTAVSGAGIPDVERDFIARCMLAVFDRAGWTEALLRWSTQATLDYHIRCDAQLDLPARLDDSAKQAQGSADDVSLLFNEPHNVAGGVIRHFTGQYGEQYMQVVFAQVIDRFSTDAASFRPMGFAAEIEEWALRFLRPVLNNTDGELLADEMKTVIALLHERVQRDDGLVEAERQRLLYPDAAALASTATPRPQPSAELKAAAEKVTKETVSRRFIGQFFYMKLVHPAVLHPLAQGLVPIEPTPAQAENLQKVALLVRAVLTGDASVLQAPNSPLADLTPADKQQLVAFVGSHFDAAADLLKGFIFSDLLEDEDEDPGLARNAPDVRPIVRFAGPACDAPGLRRHIEGDVTLGGHNPKLIAALSKALQPYSTAIHAGIAHAGALAGLPGVHLPAESVHSPLLLAASSSPAGAGSMAANPASNASFGRRQPLSPNTVTTDAAGASGNQGGAGGGSTGDAGAAARADLEETIRQLSHEVLELRHQLEASRGEESRLKLVSARLQESLAACGAPGSPASFRRRPQVRFEQLDSPRKGSAAGLLSSDSSDSESSSDSEGGDVASPRRGRAASTGAGKNTPMNPLEVGPSSARRMRHGLSPATQDYQRAKQEQAGPAVASVIPAANHVFGCPLDTYVIGRPTAHADPAEDPDL